jgi:prepilin-type N-terminal cleavage/methylation domain-containing protein
MKIADCQLPIANLRAWPASRRKQAFTLIEMLVVIAIIGILAALIVGLTSSAGATKVRSRVKTELAALETVIGKYHKEFGFYPQDHSQMPPALGLWSTNQLTPLYYELTGIEPLPAVPGVLGIRGTVNSGANAKNFAPNLPPKAYRAMPAPGNADVVLLVVSYKGPAGDYNPWHYRSSKPEHNTDGFDLWAEVTINGKTEVIPNWKE